MHQLRRALHEHLDVVAVVVGLAYVAFTGWAMTYLSYDVWGALVIAPIIAMVTVPMVRHAFRGDLQPLVVVALAGLVAKLVGTLLRYWWPSTRTAAPPMQADITTRDRCWPHRHGRPVAAFSK